MASPAASAPSSRARPAPEPQVPRASGPRRVAVVGTGFIADFHLAILADTPGVEVVCVADLDRARAEGAAARHGVGNVATSLEALTDHGVEVAHLCVPPDRHAALTRELLGLGIGVFCEKPLAESAAEARALVEQAAAAGLPLGVNHNNVFHPTFVRLVERLESGALGRVEHVQVTLAVPLRQLDAGDHSHWMFRAPRNILLEQAVHPLSQLERLLGPVRRARPTILSTRELEPGQLLHDRWVVAATAERGTAELCLAFGATFQRSSLTVLASDGCVEADLHHGLCWEERKTPWLDFWNAYLAGARRGRALLRDARAVLRRWTAFTLGLGPRRDAFWVGMRDSIRAFHAALQSGAAPPVDGARAVAVLDWCEALAGELPAAAPAPPALPEPGPPRAGEVVVTGANGFIGRRVVARLVERGAPVTAVVRRRHALPPEITAPAATGELRVVVAGLEDREALAGALEGAAACVHLATGGGDDWPAVQRSMVESSRRLGELCAERGARLVYASSTAALYAGPDAGPELGDDQPTDPRPAARALYARGKIAAEEALRALEREQGLRLVVARPGVVLGAGAPMQHSGLGLWVRDNHCVGWGRGETPLPLVWVDDVAEALVRAALHPGSDIDGRAMNLATRVPLGARAVVEELARASGRRLVFHPRALWLSQLAELGKWVIKRVGRRRVPPPAYRDLKSRALAPALTCDTARELLGWQPVEEREAFLERAVRVHAPR